jgi:glucosamine 6-phosphate synthetase-like amidotransferase/phosphosugar isomerase protein
MKKEASARNGQMDEKVKVRRGKQEYTMGVQAKRREEMEIVLGGMSAKEQKEYRELMEQEAKEQEGTKKKWFTTAEDDIPERKEKRKKCPHCGGTGFVD